VAAVYIMNQIADRSADRLNGGFPLIIKPGLNPDLLADCNACALFSVVVPAMHHHGTLAF